MTHSGVAARIGHLPQTYEAGESSTATLIRESGYLDTPDAVTVQSMEEVLRAEPELADAWLKRWGDQRIAGGWVMDCEGAHYRLKNFETGKSYLIDGKEHAFAEFIVRYVQRIGNVVAKYYKGNGKSTI